MIKNFISLFMPLVIVISSVGAVSSVSAMAYSVNARNYYQWNGDEYWEYDNDGYLIFYSDGNGYWESYSYDKINSEILCEYYYDSCGNIIHRSFYENGYISYGYYESIDGSWYEQEYNENGDVTYYENSSGYWSKYTYTYYLNGNIETEYFEDSDNEWTKTTYDEYGNVISNDFGIKTSVTTKTPTTAKVTAAAPKTTQSAKTAVTKRTTVQRVTKPEKVKINYTFNPKTRKIKFKWKKVSDAAGYQYKSALKSKYKKTKTKSTKKKSFSKKLKINQKYKFGVRAYKKVGNKVVYGKWTTKTIKLKLY